MASRTPAVPSAVMSFAGDDDEVDDDDADAMMSLKGDDDVGAGGAREDARLRCCLR